MRTTAERLQRQAYSLALERAEISEQQHQQGGGAAGGRGDWAELVTSPPISLVVSLAPELSPDVSALVASG